MGVSDGESLRWTVKDVQIKGNEGRVFTEIYQKDNLIDFEGTSDEGISWVFLDGEWWQEDANWVDGCPGLDFTMEPGNSSSPSGPLVSYSLGEPIHVDASRLQRLMGEPELTGQIVLTFREHEITREIEDQFTGQGMVESRGQFVILYYSVTNDLNSKVQPSTQLNDQWHITDDKGRRWETVDYTGSRGGVSGSAAVAKGYEQPEAWVPPGFENVTAAVFEVPADVQNLTLVWEQASIKVILN